MCMARSDASSAELWIYEKESSLVTRMAISSIPRIEAVTLPGIGTIDSY